MLRNRKIINQWSSLYFLFCILLFSCNNNSKPCDTLLQGVNDLLIDEFSSGSIPHEQNDTIFYINNTKFKSTNLPSRYIVEKEKAVECKLDSNYSSLLNIKKEKFIWVKYEHDIGNKQLPYDDYRIFLEISEFTLLENNTYSFEIFWSKSKNTCGGTLFVFKIENGVISLKERINTAIC